MAGTLGAGDADLGGGLFKRRISRPGGGKSGGYRVIVVFRQPGIERVLFAYGFAKNAASTLTPQGREALTAAALAFLAADEQQIAKLRASGDGSEVGCDDNGQG
jgi:hypothetical protein